MSKRLVFALIVMVVALVGLSACKPVCAPNQLVAPNQENPPPGSMYDYTTDSLEWSWSNQNCVPEGYLLEIIPEEGDWNAPFHSVTLDGLTTSWNFDSPPPVATKFNWRVSAFADGVYEPTDPESGSFWTGPICTGSGLIPPSQAFPAENGIETNPAGVVYTGSYQDISCIPEGIKLAVSRTEDMSVPVSDFDFGVIIKHPPQSPTKWIFGGAPAINHLDCTEYFWTVHVESGGTQGPPSPARRYTTDYGNGCSCSLNAITMAILHGPDDYAILPGTSAHLKWYNHGGCFPDGAVVQIATSPDFSNAVNLQIAGQFISEYEAQNLLPATQYFWRVAYYMDGSGGPVIGTYSGPRSFYTGPECSSLGEVEAPIRIAPADNSILNTLSPALQFAPGTPGCVPDGYLLQLHKMADFSDPNLMSEFSTPDTTIQTKPLQDCTTYHWSVTAVQDGGYGPESDRGSFSIDLHGTCGQTNQQEGMKATALGNSFCREGTFPEHHPVVWTFTDGQHALAIARNPFNTYLKMVVLNQETKEPLEEYITCWSLFSAFKPGWTLPDPPAGQYDFRDLPVEIPPPTPIPGATCSSYTNEPDCMADASCDWKFTAGAPGGYCTEK